MHTDRTGCQSESAESRTTTPVFALVRPSEPGNAGAAARSLAAFRIGRLALIEPQRPTDRADEARAVRWGRGLLADAQRVAEDGVADYLSGFAEIWGTTARGGRHRHTITPIAAGSAYARRPSVRRLILFGPERDGLDRAWLDRCHHVIRCHTPGGPLNLAHAVTVIAYELSRACACRQPPESEVPLASEAQRVALLTRVETLLADLDYPSRSLRRHPPERYLEPLRSGTLERRQVRWLMGLLARIEQRLDVTRGRTVAD